MASVSQPASQSREPRPRALIYVTDEEREVITGALLEAGFEVDVAIDGVAAVVAARDERPELLIIHVNDGMPEGDDVVSLIRYVMDPARSYIVAVGDPEPSLEEMKTRGVDRVALSKRLNDSIRDLANAALQFQALGAIKHA